MNEKRRIKRCGYIYEGLSYVKKSYKALALPVIIQLRLILLIYVILYLGDNMVVQVLLISLSTIFIIFLVGSEPDQYTKELKDEMQRIDKNF